MAQPMKSVSQVADEAYQTYLQELMTVLQYDAQMVQGKLYSEAELLGRAVAMIMYAAARNKKIMIDMENKLVMLINPEDPPNG